MYIQKHETEGIGAEPNRQLCRTRAQIASSRGFSRSPQLGLPGCTRAAPSGPTGVRTQSRPAGPRAPTVLCLLGVRVSAGRRARSRSRVKTLLSLSTLYHEALPHSLPLSLDCLLNGV